MGTETDDMTGTMVTKDPVALFASKRLLLWYRHGLAGVSIAAGLGVGSSATAARRDPGHWAGGCL